MPEPIRVSVNLAALEELQAENERLREALQKIADSDWHHYWPGVVARTALEPREVA